MCAVFYISFDCINRDNNLVIVEERVIVRWERSPYLLYLMRVKTNKRNGEGRENRGGRNNNRRNNNRTDFNNNNSQRRPKGRKPQPQPQAPKKQEPKEDVIRNITLPNPVSLKDLADACKIAPSVIIKKLFLAGQIMTVKESKANAHIMVMLTDDKQDMENVNQQLGPGFQLRSVREIGCDTEHPINKDILSPDYVVRTRFVKYYYGYDCLAVDPNADPQAGILPIILVTGKAATEHPNIQRFATFEDVKNYLLKNKS